MSGEDDSTVSLRLSIDALEYTRDGLKTLGPLELATRRHHKIVSEFNRLDLEQPAENRRLTIIGHGGSGWDHTQGARKELLEALLIDGATSTTSGEVSRVS